MKFKQYLIFKISGTILSFLAWLLVLFRVDPWTTNSLGIGIFYLTLGLAVTGFVSTGTMLFRVYALKRLYTQRLAAECFRQGVWVALTLLALLFFSSHEVMTWFNAALLILLMMLVEIFYLRLKRQPRVVWEREVQK